MICLPIVERTVVSWPPVNTGSIWNRSSLKSFCVCFWMPPVTAPLMAPPAAETSWLVVSDWARVSGAVPLRIRPRIASLESGGSDVKLAVMRGHVPASSTIRS